jgi:hypothetical protein
VCIKEQSTQHFTKNKMDTNASTFAFIFAVNATCFDPFIGSSSGVVILVSVLELHPILI